MIGNVGMGELLLIFLVTLLVFGAKRIPEIARGLGQGLHEFRSATQEIKRELNQQVHIPPTSNTTSSRSSQRTWAPAEQASAAAPGDRPPILPPEVEKAA